jgi:hypothetical protein
MSIGNLKTDGNKGNNFPWQLKMLIGQQCACDALTEIADNTDTVEPLLAQILAAVQQGTDYEAALVVDANDVTWLEIRIWNGVTFDPPVYYLAGSNTSGIPLAPITYINPNTYLAQIASYTSNLVSIEAGTPDALGQTTMSASMPVTIASDQTTLPVEIIAPLGSQVVGDSVSVALASDQFTQKVTPTIIVASGVDGSIGLPTWSVSFASNGTAAALVSFDEGTSFVSLTAGTTINMTAGIFNWYYDTNVFHYDTTTNAGASLIITYNA